MIVCGWPDRAAPLPSALAISTGWIANELSRHPARAPGQGEVDLLRAGWGDRLPVNGAIHNHAHLVEPPLSAGPAQLAGARTTAPVGSVEGHFELLNHHNRSFVFAPA